MSVRRCFPHVLCVSLGLPCLTNLAWAESSDGAAHAGHEDPVTPLLLGISVVLLAAKVGGDLMMRLKRPTVWNDTLAIPGKPD